MGGHPQKLIVFTLMDHKYGATMIVEDNMTSDDEQTLLIEQGRIAEASNSWAEADYSNDRDDTDWLPSPMESD